MDPDVVPLPSCPPLADGGELGSQDEEFGDFGGFSCSDPPASLKPASHPASCSFNRAVELSQPTSTVNLEQDRSQRDVEGRDRSADSSLHLTNGFSGRRRGSGAEGSGPDGSGLDGSGAEGSGLDGSGAEGSGAEGSGADGSGAEGSGADGSGPDGAAAVRASCPEEQTGFADFTVFGQQAVHPWCCGFSPMSSSRPWDGRAGWTDLGPAGRDVITESEPRSHHARNGRHAARAHAARARASQDQRQPQDAAAAVSFAAGEEELDEAETERSFGLSPPQVSEAGGDPGVLQRPGLSESASEDLASFTDDLSFEGVSADLEPNVSSLDQDWDPTDDEDEELELSDSLVCSRTGKLSRPESQTALHQRHQHATQETRATSNQARPRAAAEPGSADGGPELHRDQEVLQAADAGVQVLGNLPPSDSFADFCSAPTQDDGPTWAQFKDQREEGRAWNQISRLQTHGDAEEEEEEEEEEGRPGGSRRSSCQASVSCRVQQLLQTSFPEVMVAAVEAEELLDLEALLQTPRLSEEDQEPQLSGALWLQQEMLSPQRDVHSAVGLRFQWGGSHTNRTLLRCLGVDTRNIVFMGSRKQPVTVPAFASGLGMLEPTKDSVGSPGRSVVSAAPPELPDQPEASTHSAQEELPSSQPAWSSRGLSSSQDGTSPRRAPHFWGRK